MWCALLTPVHLETHFIYRVPWNDVPLLFKCSTINHYNDCEALRQTSLAVIVHTISIVKYIAKDGQSTILMPFGVKK